MFAVLFRRLVLRGDTPREEAFDSPPSTGEVAIVGGQCHDRVQVIGQDDDRIDRERTFAPGHAKGRTQSDYVVDEHGRASVRERDGEKG
jgi:hypothetical protein